MQFFTKPWELLIDVLEELGMRQKIAHKRSRSRFRNQVDQPIQSLCNCRAVVWSSQKEDGANSLHSRLELGVFSSNNEGILDDEPAHAVRHEYQTGLRQVKVSGDLEW